MNYNFDKIINRENTSSIKWDFKKKLFGREDILPLWVADMDFESPPPVKEALQKRVEHGVFGYTAQSKKYFEGIINWAQYRHQWKIERKWLQFIPGVIPGLNFCVQTFTQPGDKVIIQPPVYKPFFNAIQQNVRQVVENNLILENGHYKMDLEGLKQQIDEKTKMLILCSPHNPVGRVWTREELEELGKICLDNNIIIVSDEIHWDIVYFGHQHYPIANLSEALQQQTITLSSPGKTFNIQGFQSAYSIIANEQLREKFGKTLQKNGIFLNNVLSITAVEAAYHEGAEWLDELLVYLEENKNFLRDYCRKELPDIELIEPEGTYIAWLDCSRMDLSQDELNTFMVEKAGLGLNNGTDFGGAGKGFQRLNFACPRSRLEEALDQLKSALVNTEN